MNAPLPLVALLVTSLAKPAAALQISPQELGATPGSAGNRTQVAGVSTNGDVVVGYDLGAPGTTAAFRWTERDGYETLPGLTAAGAEARFVSDDGSFVAGKDASGSIVRWDSQGQVEIAARWAPAGPLRVQGISGDGTTVVCTASLMQHGETKGYLWTQAQGLVWLGEFPLQTGFTGFIPQGISIDGQVIAGTATIASEDYVGFHWTAATGLVDLGGPPSLMPYELDVSADGNAVFGAYQDDQGVAQAFLWTATSGYTALGSPGGESVWNAALSRDGSTGILTTVTAGVGAGYRWTAAGGLQPLAPPNLDPFAPLDLSSSGETVVGYASGPGGQIEPMRWTATGGYERLGFAATQQLLPVPYVSGSGSVTVASVPNGPLFERRAILWRADGTLGVTRCAASAPNSTGQPGRLRLIGSNSSDLAPLTLQAFDLPPHTFGLFLVSSSEGLATSPGVQGVLCLSGSIGRFVGPGQIQQSDATGSLALTIDPTVLPTPSGPIPPTPGERWFFQAWHRDANPSVTSNFTDSVAVRLY